MPTVVDELIVTLGLDPSQFKKQADEANRQLERERQAALKSGKLIEEQSRKQRQAFNAVKTEALGFLSVLAGASTLTAFAANTVKTDAAVGRLSTTLGIATEKIAKWQGVVRGVGGTNEDAIGALRTINQLGVDYRTGRLGPERAGLLGILGLGPNDLSDPDTFGLSAAAAFQRGDPRVQADRFRRLGFGDPFINSLVGGPAALQDRLASAERAATITGRDAAAAQDFERGAGRLQSTVQGLGRRGITALLPGTTQALDALSDLLQHPSGANLEVLAGALIAGEGGAAAIRTRQGRSASGGPAIGTGSASFGRVVSDFMAMGYTQAQARGMAAAMSAETAGTFSPSIRNPNSSAYGLGQWLTPRQRDFKRIMGVDIHGSTYEQQMAFLQWELQNTEKRAGGLIRGSKTEWGAMSAYVGGFMRPGRAGAALDMRHGQAVLARNTVNIGTIVVNTQATDAKGVARGLNAAIAQANTGLQ